MKAASTTSTVTENDLANFDAGVAVVLAVPVFLWRAWVIRCLWSWFAASYIGEPPAFLHVAGLLLLASCVIPRTKSSNDDKPGHAVILSALTYVVVLVVGWFLYRLA